MTWTTITPSYAAKTTEVFIVQGLPGKQLDVAIDGVTLRENIKSPAVAGPFSVQPGKRTVTFSEDGTNILAPSTFSIKEGSKADIVVHLPASSSSAPVVTVYKYGDVAVPKGEGLLVVSNAAAASRLDIRLNRQNDQPLLFSKIPDEQFKQQQVSAATYKMSFAPTGQQNPDKPLDVTIDGAAMNRVYAVGDLEKKTLTVAQHNVAAVKRKPKELRVDTGTGGQAAKLAPPWK